MVLFISSSILDLFLVCLDESGRSGLYPERTHAAA